MTDAELCPCDGCVGFRHSLAQATHDAAGIGMPPYRVAENLAVLLGDWIGGHSKPGRVEESVEHFVKVVSSRAKVAEVDFAVHRAKGGTVQ